MDELQLLIDLHKHAQRQGPGADAETLRALDLTRLDRTTPLKIADIGCGTGASTLMLAQHLNAEITAVDFLQEFLDILNDRAASLELQDKITPLCCSMDNLPFEAQEYDVIWSEGAIYNIGFAQGIKEWKRYLKKEGIMAVSEITWTSASPPEEIRQHWESEYPEIDTASSKFAILEQSGFSALGYFVLPEYCWLENYYRPLQNSFKDFLARNGDSKEARAIVEAEEREIELYEKYSNCYSYGVYIARKVE